ncbi:chromodomain-helicase-DNA-binding protein 7 isoform X5 [Hermetia illucens]|uniref:chromodomain-helicase-DNA-binding protein 7 isoform X5 n=1 Tax=Hermetia illucens TaxID=343691 RepID=UPI0018CC633C|nr:chromodomain-helicase-DNA-binding protein 7 isoform X5 [Hermetia illucens]
MDGNAQNMFHGNHQGDAYYRYDAAAAAAPTPRAMGPPGGYPRHRPPHPLPQQPQYPSYQPSAENLYPMGTDQHAGMGMGDLGGWVGGPAAPGQGSTYAAPGLGAYGHPQAAPSPQRQTQSQAGYRQHMGAYPQQEQQKLSFSTQQSLMGSMMQQPSYVGLNQQQATQQQRIPQHYPQAGSHPMYPGAPQAQSASGAQPYSPYPSAGMQHQPGRPPQHVAYSHASLDQSSYGHVPSSTAPGHLLPGQQPAPQMTGHPPQPQQNHLGQPSQNHLSVPGQAQPPQPLHPSQVVHPSQQQQTHPSANQSSLSGLTTLQSGPPQQQSQTPQNANQNQTHLSTQHMHAQNAGALSSHPNILHSSTGPVTSQHQTGPGGNLSIPHGMVPGYSVQHQSPQQPQQSPYMTTAKPQSATQLSSSPQYRAPFPQSSPQMSPRPPQMSPHSQMSPRPVMSPAKPPQQQQAQLQANPPNTPSPHHNPGLSGITSPRPMQQQPPQPIQPPSKSGANSQPPTPVNTLQALEQMVMPSQNSLAGPGGNLDYPQAYRQQMPNSNPMSPMGPRMPMSPQHHQQWTPLMNMQPPGSNAPLGNISTQPQQQPSQQHLYAQPLSHQGPQPIPPPHSQSQQQTHPQASANQQPLGASLHVNEQLQHPINDLTPPHPQQQVPVSQTMPLPPHSLAGNVAPPQPQQQPQMTAQQHIQSQTQQSQMPPQASDQLQQPTQLQPQPQPNSSVLNSNIVGENNGSLSESHLLQSTKSPVASMSIAEHTHHSLIDTFTNPAISTPSPQLKSIDHNSNDSAHLTTDSSNNVLVNRPPSVVGHDSNSANSINHSMMFSVPVDTNSMGADYENSNQQLITLESKQTHSQQSQQATTQSEGHSEPSFSQMHPQVQSPEEQTQAQNSETSQEESSKEGFPDDQTRCAENIEEMNENSENHLLPSSPENNSNQVSTEQSVETDSKLQTTDASVVEESNELTVLQPTTVQNVSNEQSYASTELTQLQPAVNAIQANQAPQPQQSPQQSQQTNQQIPPIQPAPAINANSMMTPPAGMHPLVPTSGLHGIPPSIGQLPPQPTAIYDPQQQMIMGGVLTSVPPSGIQPIPPHMPPQMMGAHPITPFPSGPILHNQERAALQQQLQELYCMPPAPEQQEKIMRLQERLNSLQQHETNDQCNGGPQCILQNPIYGNQMVESPQVSSTTGRGRSKGSSKPRKPRQKKEKNATPIVSADSNNGDIPPTSLPVSEDCVTQGAGDTSVTLSEFNESCELSQDNSSNELDASTTEGKKPKKPRKPRPPKDPNKPPKEKVPKEKKKKEPKDPDKPKKKKSKKADSVATENSPDGKTNDDSSQGAAIRTEEKVVTVVEEHRSTLNDETPDFDDIPVSKIIKNAPEETRKEGEENNEDSQKELPENPDGNTPKKKKKSSGSSSRKRPPAGSKSSSKKKKKGRIVPESDGEADDLLTTPPPSPQNDSEIDSSKRRSARNTQRKKYIDDVMLRFSDDESGLMSSSPAKKEKNKPSAVTSASATSSDGEKRDSNSPTEEVKPAVEGKEETADKDKQDEANKPNYVYVNTGDEDSMVVQYVLSVRIGKRELKPDPPPPPPEERKVEETRVDGDAEVDANSETKNVAEGSKESETEAEGENEKDEETESGASIEETAKVVEQQDEGSKGEISEPTANENEAVQEVKPNVEPVVEEDSECTEEKMDTDEVNQDEKANAEAMDIDEVKSSSQEVSATEEDEDSKEDTINEKCESPEKKDDGEGSEKIQSKVENDGEEKKEPVFIEVEEYLVKYRNFSYLHCEWRTEEELFRGDRRIASKIKRFQMKQAQQMNIFDNIEEEPFNPDFIEVDRVLDMSEHTDAQTGEVSKHYLVKWKSLPYEDCTWELEEDVDEDKIEQYHTFNKVPPKSEWKPKKRPTADMWKKLEATPIFKNNNTLRPYQLEGLNWLKFSWYNGRNCILADEMGLGKTIQSLTFVHSVWEYGMRGPFLVIAPLSTIPNWQREFEGWTDMNIIVYHGSVTSKQMIQEYEFYFKNDSGKVIKDITKFNVLITTFEMIVTDYNDLRNFNWRVCVIDEAHRLKNRNCKLLEGLRQLNLEHRVLLSGTPLQNNVNELFSLLNFLEPQQFSCSDSFLKDFGSLKTEDEVQKLQALLKPMMLRRLKDDVEKSLAPKEETIVEVELTNIQKKYYRGILEQNFSFLKKGTTSANIPNLMNTMMELRKCCIHPYLLNGAEDQIQYDYKISHGDDHDAYYKNLVNSAGKMVLIDKLLPKLKANGHRVLIFSQMVRCLDLLEDYLMYKKYPFERIDGRIRGNLRQAAIDRFSRPDSDRFVFLLCTKAGGLGINLTAADTVIIYDSDWNPQNDLQAQARCHRIGQQKMVKIYRLLCRNTYEREMFDKASLKLGLDKAILQSMNTQGKDGSSNRQLSKKEIEDLLRKGAYGAVMDDDNAGDKFCEEDIDSILKRRTQVITMENEKGSTFSKASFAASGNRSDIKIDDPDFWNKWAKRADIDPDAGERDETEDLVISEPRRRTQIKRYGHDDGVMDMSEESSAENSDEDSIGLRSRRRKEKLAAKRRGGAANDDYIPRDRDTLAALGLDEIQYGSWAKSECFKVEKGLLSFGWGRWTEIQELGQFKRGWRETDIEDCARIILLYCLHVYKGDEKIKNFIWDLITPTEDGEVQKISRDHSGLHNLVPRGRNAKGRNGGKGGQKDPNKQQQDRDKVPGGQNILDPNHWSKDEKYDAETFLEGAYKKHLGRHANKVLLRVRMLYYIQHEVIGDLVSQINEGVHARNEDDANSKHEDAEDVDEDGMATKDSDSKAEMDRPCSSGLEEEENASSSFMVAGLPVDDNTWPSMQDLNTRLRRVITSYQRNYKKEELKMQQKAKLQALVSTPSQPTQTTTMGGVQIIPGAGAVSAASSQANTSTGVSMQGTSAGGVGGNMAAVVSGVMTPTSTNISTLANQNQSSSQPQAQSSAQGAQMPSAADIGLMLSLLNPTDPSQLANLDLNKLAMYLKMERQSKIEQAAKERERSRLETLPKKWNRREENEFLRVLTGYGIDLQPSNIPAPDWLKFKAMSKLDRKSDETLSDYYKVFIAMCKRQAGVKLSECEKGFEGIIDDISEDHARLVLDRLELLSKLREISRHPVLDERLKLCQNNYDTPDWWEPGHHDKELIAAVLKHGLYKSEYYIFNDPSFSFSECERRFSRELETQFQRNIKIEAIPPPKAEEAPPLDGVTLIKEVPLIKDEPSDNIKSEVKEEMEVKTEVEPTENESAASEANSEAKEEVDESEKDTVKEEGEEKEKVDEESMNKSIENADEDREVKSEEENEKKKEEKVTPPEEDEESKIVAKKEVEDAENKDVTSAECLKKESTELLDLASSGDPDDDEVMKEKEKAVEEECKKQAAELKARFPDLEVIQPQLKVKTERDRPKVENMMMVRWFRDFALEKRISHIVTCVEKNQWPVGKNYSAYIGCQGVDLDIPLYETIKHVNLLDRRSATPDVITITTDQGVPKHLQAQLSTPSPSTTLSPLPPVSVGGVPGGANVTVSPAGMVGNTGGSGLGKKRKKHIAIDVETERAKLHALLNSTQVTITGQKWDDDGGNCGPPSSGPDSRRSNPLPSQQRQPPPAHQHQPLTRQAPSTSFNKSGPMQSPQSSMGAMDLSAGLPKVNLNEMKSPIDLSEVQDFSMGSKKQAANLSMNYGGPTKGKLDDTLSKLMKKNNCQIEEPPVIGKEKKRKKLDEIVLGLSAAKEQKTFPDPSLPSSKKPQITPSVSVTPAVPQSAPTSQPNQKPFTITVTSVPGTSKGNPASSPSSSNSGLAALQNMAMGGGSSSKDSLNSLLAQTMSTDPQSFIKQQQKLLQQMPASQRKAYEGMLAEMKQAMEFSAKYSSHDAKVNKWLAEQNAALNDQLNMDYRRSTRQHGSNMNVPTSTASQLQHQQQQHQQAMQQQAQQQQKMGLNSLTGEEYVPVINKQTGKRISGNKAPQLKRLMQWLSENPAYEIDPKWIELIQMQTNPMPAPSPKSSGLESSGMGSSSSGKGHGGRGQSSSANNSSSSGMGSTGQQQQSKKGRPSVMDQANAMQFASLAGLNPSLLSSLPGLGFDPKNPLLMPFGSMPGLGGMGGLGNLNMNFFANLAGLGGIGNLAGMDTQSLAALMAAAGGANLGNLTGTASGKVGSSPNTTNKKNKGGSESQQQSQSQGNQSNKTPTSSASGSSAQNNSGFPFLFPNPSLLYPPLGLSGLNPYSLSPYDQLAQQYNLLNGGASGSGSGSNTSGGSTRQSQGKSSSSRTSALGSSGMSSSTTSSGRGRGSASSRNNESSQLSSLLMPSDPHLLESLSRMTGMDIAQASRLMGSSQPGSDKRSSSMSSKDSQEKQAEKDRQKWMENLARGALPPDLAAIQAFTQGKLPMGSGGSGKGSSKNQSQLPLGMPPDINQALLAEMAAQAMAAATTGSGSGSKRSRDQDMKDVFEQNMKQMDLYTRALGLGAGISLTPTSSIPLSEDHKPKRPRTESHISNSSKDDVIPLNLGSSSDKSSRGDLASLDKVTLTPVAAASIAASLPSQTTITIAPPTSSGASTSSGCSEPRSSLTVSSCEGNSALKQQLQHVSDTEVEDLVVQPKYSKPPTPIETSPPPSAMSQRPPSRPASRATVSPTASRPASVPPPPPTPPAAVSATNDNRSPAIPAHPSSETKASINEDEISGGNTGASSTSGSSTSRGGVEERRSGRLKRPRSSAVHEQDGCQPPERKRELRSTMRTRQSGNSETLNLSTSHNDDGKDDR